MKNCLRPTRFLPYMTLLWFFGCGVLLIPDMLSAESTPRILLINSDAAVTKYKEPQETFKQVIAQSVVEVDLGDKKWESSNIEDFLYDEDPDIIYCIGTKAYLFANKYAPKKNIVFSSIINWLRLPITDKTYGVSNELHAGMEMTLFRLMFPNVQKIGVLYSRKYTEEWFKNAENQAKEMGVEISSQAITDKKQTLSALKKLLPKIDAFWLISDPELISTKEDLLAILQECDAQKKPVFSYQKAFAELGAVLIVSVDDPTIGRQAAGIVTAVLSGDQLDNKVQFPAGTYTILNLKKVKEYGLQYNEGALDSVNEIIQ
jgi:putative tryptophan/tyrosine transport system substrate-binding protein